MSWNIPLCSNGFPAPLAGTLPNSFAITEADLFWAALTVGRPRPTRHAAWLQGQRFIDEAMWRIGMVRANLDLGGVMTGLYHSPAFNALDPTEKGWVNFSFGMIFAKICASQFLDIPWLMHFKWFQTHNLVTMLPGGSTPDFIGVSAASGQHHVVEAKGRNEPINRVQIVTQIIYARDQFPGHPIRALVIKALDSGELLFVEFANEIVPSALSPIRFEKYRLLGF